jgi:hypothetical protein
MQNSSKSISPFRSISALSAYIRIDNDDNERENLRASEKAKIIKRNESIMIVHSSLVIK